MSRTWFEPSGSGVSIGRTLGSAAGAEGDRPRACISPAVSQKSRPIRPFWSLQLRAKVFELVRVSQTPRSGTRRLSNLPIALSASRGHKRRKSGIPQPNPATRRERELRKTRIKVLCSEKVNLVERLQASSSAASHLFSVDERRTYRHRQAGLLSRQAVSYYPPEGRCIHGRSRPSAAPNE